MKTEIGSLKLFGDEVSEMKGVSRGETVERLKRLDLCGELRERLLPFCRLKYGEIWEDPVYGHRVGVLDAAKMEDVKKMVGDEKTKLVINDPPYNIVTITNTSHLFKVRLEEYLDFSKRWVTNAIAIMHDDAHFYVWMGADYRDNFQPLPDFMMMMRDFKELRARNIITLRNQRGYGTQRNWMWVRQELLYYVRGSPNFNVAAEYTGIPKVLRGYYKEVDGRRTENLERSRSSYLRAGNVWIDIQQVFYRMEENVPGCYAQKPLRAVERIIAGSSSEKDLVIDFFAHSGTTVIAGERLKRRVYTFDIDPLFSEMTIRRLEHFRSTGETGWQWRNPFHEVERH
ncbi:MAG: DNA-methyltransferase [Candidatus Binatia bacterium]